MKVILVFATLIALGLSYSCPEKDIDFEHGGFDMLDLGPDSTWEDCGKYLLTFTSGQIRYKDCVAFRRSM